MESDGDKEVVRKSLLHYIDEELQQRGHQGTPLSRHESSRSTPSHPYHDQSTLRISDSRGDLGSSHHSESPHSTPNLSARRRSSGSEVKFLVEHLSSIM